MIVPLQIQVTQGMGTEFEGDKQCSPLLSCSSSAQALWLPWCNGDPGFFCPAIGAWVRCTKRSGWTPKIHS